MGAKGEGTVETNDNAARPTGRPRKHNIEDLVSCLGVHHLTTAELLNRANTTLDMSRATFYRLLEQGRKEFRFRQSATDQKWRLISISQKG
jgi:hypothetical protein